MTWEPVKQYIANNLKVQHTVEEPIHFAEYEPETLEHIVNTQQKIISYM
jgi:hypothetical protein